MGLYSTTKLEADYSPSTVTFKPYNVNFTLNVSKLTFILYKSSTARISLAKGTEEDLEATLFIHYADGSDSGSEIDDDRDWNWTFTIEDVT